MQVTLARTAEGQLSHDMQQNLKQEWLLTF